jgi:hypothetical protein
LFSALLHKLFLVYDINNLVKISHKMQEIAFHSLRKSKTFNWTIYDIVAKALGMGENAIKTLANS